MNLVDSAFIDALDSGGLAGLGIPEHGGSFTAAECKVGDDIVITEVPDPVDVGTVVKMTMDVAQLSGSDISEVRGDVDALEDVRKKTGMDVLPSGVPDIGNYSSEFSLVIKKGSGFLRSLSHEDGAVVHQRLEFPQDLKAHRAAVVTQDENLVLHSGLGDKVISAYGKNIEDAVRIDEVEGVASGDLRKLMAVDTGDVGILAIEEENIGHVLALLEHVAASCQIVRPVAGVFGPCLVTVEPLSEYHQPHSGTMGIGRLVGTLVDDETVESV